MSTEESDLVTYLLVENRKLRQLYLVEQQKALTERRRRIIAEARLAAYLSNKSIGSRRSDLNAILSQDMVAFDKADRVDSSRNIKESKPVLERSPHSTTSSIHNSGDENLAESASSQHTASSAQSSPLSNKTNKSQPVTTSATVQRLNVKSQTTPSGNSFWLFIDENGENMSSMEPTLDSTQQKLKDAFIRRSTERQLCIKEASLRRKELAAQKRRIAKQLLAGHTVNRDAVKLLGRMDREIYAFAPQTMKCETFRRVRKTREFQEKKKKRRDNHDAHVNRLLAYCYSQVPYISRQKILV